MKSPSQTEALTLGLRERKKMKTFTAIQQHALRLFRQQGYDATTIEQIAAAAEVSPSTFFRYFPTKEDLVVRDIYDALIVEAFKAQPAECSPIQAARRAIAMVFSSLSAKDVEDMWVRVDMARDVPELRAAVLDELTRSLQLFAAVLAERLGCGADDLRVRTFSGVLMGVSLTVMVSMLENPQADFFAEFDAGLAFVEAGMPL
jgi:AcrR family transcriptional regulator